MEPYTLSKSYAPISLEEVPTNSKGTCLTDLYVYVPSQSKFVLYVLKGQILTFEKINALKKHSVPTFFKKKSEESEGPSVSEGPSNSSGLNFEILGLEGNKVLKYVYESLMANVDTPPAEAILALEKLSDQIIMVFAPEAQGLRHRLIQTVKHLWLMNDASAIMSIAVLIASANGINSAKPIREIVFAALVMDLPLSKMNEADLVNCYRDLKSQAPEIVDQYKRHPTEAYQLAKRALKHLSDPVFELIQTHHELSNGTGFPRKLRVQHVFPLGQFFSAAVDIFETIKRSQQSGTPLTVKKVVLLLLNEPVEPQFRRHSRRVLENVIKFIGDEAV